MNRQTRLEGSTQWNSHGNCTFFQAIRNEAIRTSEKHGIGKWIIEVRCETEPGIIDTFDVQTSIHAEVLNPRKGDV